MKHDAHVKAYVESGAWQVKADRTLEQRIVEELRVSAMTVPVLHWKIKGCTVAEVQSIVRSLESRGVITKSVTQKSVGQNGRRGCRTVRSAVYTIK